MAGLRAKIALARLAGAAVRASGRGGGTSLPGKLLIRLEPHAIGELAARLPEGNVVISATNGKTTTAAMVAAIVAQTGTPLVHNASGANMSGGIASTLIGAARGGGMRAQLGLFEVDEFWLGQVVDELRPRALLLANLFRDQLDRYGELDTIADRWAEITGRQGDGTRLVLNADDPLIADLGRNLDSVTYFGVEDAPALETMQHASDSTHCRNCGTAYVYSALYLGHLGRYACPHCGNARPEPSVGARDVELLGTEGARFTLTTPEGSWPVQLGLPGLYNVYNALAAAALCRELGIAPAQIQAGLAATTAAFGRAERVTIGDTELQLLLIKNPAGANEVLRTIALEPNAEIDLLGVLNDRIADGRDVSWIWDADWEPLAGRIRHVTCAGTRAAELALRLKYAGVPVERISVVPGLEAALDAALARSASTVPTGPGGDDGRGPKLYAVPTYTAMLALRAELSRRGHVDDYWNEAA